ncbi:uncharacterized protein A4U43_C05F26860 [Asparagus officinalis]|uniref:rRNA methyltransferase 1, mitochondrial n=1 Tax=Asparagus officinalis TaxID=4686 RepID=A0A5P1EZ30_ASPOF|nr:uncharacterized protein LOC109840634 [Asparagus officinalis]ONK69799.1 uncharacterized protein A4U43_C05F26860 [Asparagus officinalis]
MYCSNLARSPAIPLFSRVSIRPKCSKGNGFDPSSLAIQFHPKTLRNDAVSRPKISTFSFNPKPRNFSTGFLQKTLEISSSRLKFKNFSMGNRGFSTAESSVRDKGRKRLPWIAGYKDKEGRREEKRGAVKTSRSSWVDSAENYLSRNGGDSLNERTEIKDKNERSSSIPSNGRNREARVRRRDLYEEKPMEELQDAEPIDDPRWDGIRRKYKGSVDREPRFEKPEVRNWSKQENWGRNVWKEAKESSIPKMVGQAVYGVGPVLAALTVERREFYALYVQEGLDLSGNNRKKKDKKAVEKVLKLAEKLGLKVIETSKHDLNMIVDSRPHQGLVLDASSLELVNVKELEPVSVEGRKAPVWVALDEVTDPQNLGAIVRSSYFFGVDGVVLCAKNSAPLSGVVSKASAGSLELIELRSCKNMMQFLSSSIENGWRVLGGSVSSKARPLCEVEDRVPTILVLGSEGSGLRPLVERSCTELVRIPGSVSMDESAGDNEFEMEETDQSGKGQEMKSFLAVESLNVSVAAGVLLYHLVGNNSRTGAV